MGYFDQAVDKTKALGGNISNLTKPGGNPGGPAGGFFGAVGGMNPFATGGFLGPKGSPAAGGGVDMQKPELADYRSPLGADGNLASQYQVGDINLSSANNVGFGSIDAGNVTAGQLDTGALGAEGSGLGMMRDVAGGNSPWLGQQLQRQGAEESYARDRAVQSARGANAGAESQLAMRGGLSGGARERLAAGGAQGVNMAQQDIARQGQLERFGLQSTAEQQRLGMLPGLAAGELSQSQFTAGLNESNLNRDMAAQQFNVGAGMQADQFNVQGQYGAAAADRNAMMQQEGANANLLRSKQQMNRGAAMGALTAENQRNLDRFGIEMGEYGAEKTAQGIEKGGSKGGLAGLTDMAKGLNPFGNTMMGVEQYKNLAKR